MQREMESVYCCRSAASVEEWEDDAGAADWAQPASRLSTIAAQIAPAAAAVLVAAALLIMLVPPMVVMDVPPY
ncbi:hypothetical protein MANAM107_07500 [Actinomyces capricornis]|uniref:Uncharacterized protein n=1 Tax=Actinomyces capricornis TaxID=2755559 RepID=A0ABM7U918_9ACTO|nr:hypothetical protein MANAM107_07500 [Actinomyces capricornis]